MTGTRFEELLFSFFFLVFLLYILFVVFFLPQFLLPIAVRQWCADHLSCSFALNACQSC